MAFGPTQTPSKIQNTAIAAKFFEAELAFTTTPSGLKNVVEGAADGVIVDLRREQDFDEGHVPHAINLPFDRFDSFDGNEKEFPGLSKVKINYL